MTGTPHRAPILADGRGGLEGMRGALDHARAEDEGERTAAADGEGPDPDRFHCGHYSGQHAAGSWQEEHEGVGSCRGSDCSYCLLPAACCLLTGASSPVLCR